MLVAILSAFLLIQDAICLERTWSNRLGKILRTIVPDKVWAAERPFIWNSIDVGGRSAIVKLSNNNLLVHSPVNYDNQLKKSLLDISPRQKSPAAFIIAPSYEHLKYTSQWSSTFPGAKVIGCPGLKEKEPNLPIQLQFGDAIDEMRLSMLNKEVDHIWFDCELNPFTGKPFFNEVVFYHKASKALLITDLFWNYPSSSLPNYAGRMSSIPMNFEENLTPFPVPWGTSLWKFGMDKVYWPFYQRFMVGNHGPRRDKYNQAVMKLLQWDVEVIIPCHGDVIYGKNLCREVLVKHFVSRK